MSVIAATLGALSWSASEYAIHRFVGHGPRRTGKPGLLSLLTPSGLAARFNDEHIAHHSNPLYFAPTSHKLVAATLALAAIGGAGSLVFGPRRGLAFGAGFAASYLGYEILHRRIHVARPRGPFGRWARRHHLLHHHKAPRKNHGVTNPVFDLLFGTYVPLEVVKIPRKAPPKWLVDPATGDVREQYRADYKLVGQAASAADAQPRPAPTTADAPELVVDAAAS
ncbi:MAG: sterol desaturase family protein [Polyangiaceae bacterium]